MPKTASTTKRRGRPPSRVLEVAHKAPKGAQVYTVFDDNARLKPREHEVNGTIYALSATKACEVPEADALFFLCDDAFRVFDAEGKRLMRSKPSTTVPGAPLRANEIVATYAELHIDALTERAQEHDPRASRSWGRERLIALLLKTRSSTAVPPANTAAVGQRNAVEEEVDLEDFGDGEDDGPVVDDVRPPWVDTLLPPPQLPSGQ